MKSIRILQLLIATACILSIPLTATDSGGGSGWPMDSLPTTKERVTQLAQIGLQYANKSHIRKMRLPTEFKTLTIKEITPLLKAPNEITRRCAIIRLCNIALDEPEHSAECIELLTELLSHYLNNNKLASGFLMF